MSGGGAGGGGRKRKKKEKEKRRLSNAALEKNPFPSSLIQVRHAERDPAEPNWNRFIKCEPRTTEKKNAEQETESTDDGRHERAVSADCFPLKIGFEKKISYNAIKGNQNDSRVSLNLKHSEKS